MSPEEPGIGILTWIGLRPGRRGPMMAVSEARLDSVFGLEGDHAAGRSGRKRQVTLIEAGHLRALEILLGRPVPPELLRRNLVVEGLALSSLRCQTFRIGEVLLKATGACHPCSRMETALGPGGLRAMKGKGGFTAEVLAGGRVRLGDPVVPVQPDLFGGWPDTGGP